MTRDICSYLLFDRQSAQYSFPGTFKSSLRIRSCRSCIALVCRFSVIVKRLRVRKRWKEKGKKKKSKKETFMEDHFSRPFSNVTQTLWNTDDLLSSSQRLFHSHRDEAILIGILHGYVDGGDNALVVQDDREGGADLQLWVPSAHHRVQGMGIIGV